MVNVCADPDDFQLDSGGRLQLNPHFVQTANPTFQHVLDGTLNVFEPISEIAALIVPTDGTWVVTADMRGLVSITPAAIGTAVECQVKGAFAVNNVVVADSVTRLVTLKQDAPLNVQPQLQAQATGTATKILALSAGDTLRIYGARSDATDAGTSAQILSDTNGRCRLTAWRIGT